MKPEKAAALGLGLLWGLDGSWPNGQDTGSLHGAAAQIKREGGRLVTLNQGLMLGKTAGDGFLVYNFE